MNLSQEELAEKLFVSRQTVSNWETGKNYPDIRSLLLLSTLFNISLDQLIKGDVAIMKEEIKETEIKKLNRCGIGMGIFTAATVLLTVPLTMWINGYALIPLSILFGIAMLFAVKAENIKKDNNVYTYKEIVAFAEGKRLDEIEKQQEWGKRPYQRWLLALASGLAAAAVCLIMWFCLGGDS